MHAREINDLRAQAFVSVSLTPGETKQAFESYFTAVRERTDDPGRVRKAIRTNRGRLRNAESTAIVAPAYVMYDNDLAPQAKAGAPIRIVSAVVRCRTASTMERHRGGLRQERRLGYLDSVRKPSRAMDG